jgi:hypothetical protein
MHFYKLDARLATLLGGQILVSRRRKMSFLAAFLTVAASGVVAALIAYRLNATKEHVFFLRQKIESLYLSIEKYDKKLGSHFIPYYSVFRNEISYNDALNLTMSSAKSEGNDSGEALDVSFP